MELEREIKLLKEKVELLEKIKELQDQINQYRQPYYVPIPYPIYPNPWIIPHNPYYPTITWTIDTGTGTYTDSNIGWSYT